MSFTPPQTPAQHELALISANPPPAFREALRRPLFLASLKRFLVSGKLDLSILKAVAESGSRSPILPGMGAGPAGQKLSQTIKAQLRHGTDPEEARALQPLVAQIPQWVKQFRLARPAPSPGEPPAKPGHARRPPPAGSPGPSL